jgi:nickel/cobalt exporter
MKKFILILLICVIILLGYPLSAEAHPADMYYHTHLVRLTPQGLEVTWEVMPGPMIAQSIWFAADKDQDDGVSVLEAEAWARTIVGAFSGELDQQPLDLVLDQVLWPDTIEELYQGNTPIRIYLKADWPGDLGQSQLVSLHNRFNPKSSLSWFEVIAEDGLGFDLPAQNSGTIELSFGFGPGESSPERLVEWESGSPQIPWVIESVGLGELAQEAAAEGQTSPAEGSGPASILEGLIKNQEGSLPFWLASLALAALLGALHALSPGHGKTIVAAYLVGSKGKAYHAVALGAIVTLTHTGSVFALGLIMLTASRYFLAADIFPILELISGLLILVLGLGLLWPRLRTLLLEYQDRARFEWNDQGVVVEGERRLVINQPVREIGPPHSHDPSEMGAIPRQIPGENPLENIRWRSLIPLAISGGLVPCPDAIAILLVAATINRIGFGLSLILAFSLGLALILIAVGLLIVQGRKLFQRLRWFNRAALVMPVFSALIVLGAGVFLSVGAFNKMQQGASPSGWITVLSEPAKFDLDETSVIYTALDENQRAQLIFRPASGGDPVAITNDQNIWYFAVSPDHGKVAFATDDGANGSQIWTWERATGQLELIQACEEAYCSEFAWSPDGQGLLYSRLDFDPEINPANVQTIWWLDLETLQSEPLFQDALTPGFSPRWSPDGKWLSYTSINPLEVRFYHMESGESQALPSGLGYPAVWSPDSSQVILQDIYFGEYGYLNKLYSYDLEDEWLTMLAYGKNFDEAYPAWSPDGQWLAVVRRAWLEGVPEVGNQVWTMRPDGTEARQLTTTDNTTYGQPAWSPDSRYLVFDYRAVVDQEVVSGVIILDTQSGTIREIADSGNRPAWLE